MATTHPLMVIMVIAVRATGVMVGGVIMVLGVTVTVARVIEVMVAIADSTFFSRSCILFKSAGVWNQEGRVGQMRGFLINKNLCFYYWLRKRIGKRQAYRVSHTFEKIILIFGREGIL